MDNCSLQQSEQQILEKEYMISPIYKVERTFINKNLTNYTKIQEIWPIQRIKIN